MRTNIGSRISSNAGMLTLMDTGFTSQSLISTCVFDTLDSPLTDTVWMNPYFKYAQSFTTGSSSCTLESVTLGMMGGVAKNGGGFFISIYDATGLDGGPGNHLSSQFTGPDDPAFGSNEYFGELELNANMTYWVVARVAHGGGTYGWNTTDEVSVSSDNGFSESFALKPEWSTPDRDSRLHMKVNVIQRVRVQTPDPIPELGMQMLMVAMM